MDNTDIINQLTTLWFSQKESLIYTTLLQLDGLPASTLARHTWLKRPTVFLLCQELAAKWLITICLKGETQFFSARDPNILMVQYQEKKERIENIIPWLLWLMWDSHTSTNIEYYEWFEWLRHVYMDILTTKVDASTILWFDYMDVNLEKWIYDILIPLRVKNGIHSRVIISGNTDSNYLNKNTDRTKTDIKCVSKFPLSIKWQIYISTDQIRYLLLRILTERWAVLLSKVLNYTILFWVSLTIFDRLQTLFSSLALLIFCNRIIDIHIAIHIIHIYYRIISADIQSLYILFFYYVRAINRTNWVVSWTQYIRRN